MPKPRIQRHEVVQPDDQSIRLIPLTKGQNAIVDANDFEWLSQWNWYACRNNMSGKFYAYRTVAKRGVPMHRVILGFPEQVDHRNGNTLDNRRENIRACTCAQNACNRSKHSNNRSGIKGVRRSHGKWCAQIGINGKNKHLGLFRTAGEAASAYKRAAMELHGDFAHAE